MTNIDFDRWLHDTLADMQEEELLYETDVY
jgi:hypothetical protein